MKIDMHVHTSELSGCAKNSLEEQVIAAISRGIDSMFITDHMRLHPMEQLNAINERYAPFKVYQGIEVSISQDNYEDILVYGIHDTKIERRSWSYEALYKYVKSNGGVVVLAHPYRFSDRIDAKIWEYPTDGVEVLSSNIGSFGYERRKALAQRLSAGCFTNSDGHDTDTVGCYANEFPEWCQDEKSIIQAIIARNFQCSGL